MSTSRRFFFYLVSTITLGIMGGGIGQLLSLVFDLFIPKPVYGQVGRVAFNQQQFSLGLAMLIIGGVLWLVFWSYIQRRTAKNEAEIGSGIRKLFLNLIIVSAAQTALFTAINFVTWLLAGAAGYGFTSGELAGVLVAGAIWYYHWRVSEKEGQPSPAARTLRRWYIYILSGISLILFFMGPVELLGNIFSSLPVWGRTSISTPLWNEATRRSIAFILMGGLSWFFHWMHMAKGDLDSTLRQVYLYLLGILGSAVTGLVAVSITLYQLFLLAFGTPPGSADLNLIVLSWTVPTIIVAIAFWSYHRRLAEEEAESAQENQLSAQRVHSYLMSFLGLGTMVSGIIFFFGLFIDLIINATNAPVVSSGWWQRQLSLSLALLLVGTPLWLYYWSKVLKRVAAGGVSEWKSASRRIFLYGVVAIAIIGLAADLVNIIYRALNAILGSINGSSFWSVTRWSWQTLLPAAAVLGYHWQVLREDYRRGSEPAVMRKQVTVLVGEDAGQIVSGIEARLGYKVKVLYSETRPENLLAITDQELDDIIGQVQASKMSSVMLVASGGKLLVLPYRKK
jgi:hypothetical protein